MTLKDNMLMALEEGRGTDISGQELARRFGVSRNAVWKAVNALRADGWEIDSATNRGYRLSPGCDRLSAPLVERYMGPDRVPVYVLDSIDSTNDEAKRRIAAGGKEDFLLLAEEQTGGRGRSGKTFFSPRGTGLYMSLVVHPDMDLADAAGMTCCAAVCAAREMSGLAGRECGVKWVNDIYLAGKKVCGILTEAVTDLETGGVDAVVVGIGINIRQSSVPPGLEDIIGFLGCEGPVRNRLAAAIARGLLRYDGLDGYLDEYRSRSIVLGRRVTYMRDGEAVSGLAADIDSGGGLVVVRPDGGRETLRSGEIALCGIEGLK